MFDKDNTVGNKKNNAASKNANQRFIFSENNGNSKFLKILIKKRLPQLCLASLRQGIQSIPVIFNRRIPEKTLQRDKKTKQKTFCTAQEATPKHIQP